MNLFKSNSVLLLLSLVIVCFSVTSYAQQGVILKTSPNALYEKMINYGPVKNLKGEGFCWNARVGMDQFIDNYILTKNTEWLDAGVKYFDFLINKMDTGPDGYKGWIGPYMYDNKYWIDSHVGDAILLSGMLDFSVLVLEDKTLKSKYEYKANLYVEIAKKDLIEKCDKRGTWKEDGDIGAYVSYEKYMEPGNLKEWKYGKEVIKSGLSHPFNKQNDMGLVCIRLYRITGDRFYFDRAEKIFLRMKRQLQYYDNHYEWNYWEPFGPWDIDFNRKRTVHWVGINPSAHYQAREVAQMVDAYENGIVFDSTDIQRIINTHLNVMWNKDKVHPAFTNSNIAHVPLRNEGGKPTGTLWTALLGFDQRIRNLYLAQFKEDSLTSPKYLYFKNIIAKNPPDFTRKYIKGPVSLPDVNFSECKNMNMAVVIPGVVKKGQKSVIINSTWKPGEMEIALFSAEGNKKIKSLYKGPSYQLYMLELDGTDADKKEIFKGNYRVRWTIGNEYREYPITIL